VRRHVSLIQSIKRWGRRGVEEVSDMHTIELYLIRIVTFFTTNWIAAAILAGVVIVLAIKKPKELFKLTAFIVLVIGVFYIMMFLEQSMFSGVSSGQKSYNEELRTGGDL